MSKLSNSILDTIYKQKIAPRSRWYFITMYAFLWIIFGITLSIGTIGVSLLFFEIGMPERPYMYWVHLSWPMVLLPYLPFLWGIGSMICVSIAYFIFYKTERWYRFGTVWIVWILILGSLGWGYILHKTKLNELGEKNIRHFIPHYERMRNDFYRWIPLPESGILLGRIESISGETYIVRSLNKTLWNVSINCKKNGCEAIQKTLAKNQPMIFIGKVKENTGNKIFEASDIQIPPKKKRREWKNVILEFSPKSKKY